jgi:hypothetical protein
MQAGQIALEECRKYGLPDCHSFLDRKRNESGNDVTIGRHLKAQVIGSCERSGKKN